MSSPFEGRMNHNHTHEAGVSAPASLVSRGGMKTEEVWHADDCGGTCDGCGHIAADGFWYNAACPDALLQYQLDWAENGVPNAVRA